VAQLAGVSMPNGWSVELDSEISRAQQFITSGEFGAAARLLARLSTESSQADTAAAFDAARALCVSCAEHLRLGAELEGAAQKLLCLCRSLRPAELAGRSAPSQPDPSHQTVSAVSEIGPPGPATEVTVAVLGSLEVTIQGRRVTGWGSQKSRTLFQYLVLHADRPARREVLMELLWPAHSSRSARNSLNVCLYGLRRSLHHAPPVDQYVVYRDGCYLLNPEVTWRIDRDEFLSLIAKAQAEARAGRVEQAIERYQSAIAVYRGQLLEDDPRSEWFEVEQRSLHERHLQALDDLALLHLRRGNIDAADNVANRILQQDAGRESAHRVLMRCHSQRHQQSLVARQFRLCLATLQRELGVSPAEETQRLFRELTAAPQPS
jgi:DNA-binding SARP family transcriptional activator